MTNDEAVAILERMGRMRAMRRGMASGYVSVSVGAGNPACFFEVVYKHDSYGPSGFTTDSPPAIAAEGRTLVEAIEKIWPLVQAAHGHEAGRPWM